MQPCRLLRTSTKKTHAATQTPTQTTQTKGDQGADTQAALHVSLLPCRPEHTLARLTSRCRFHPPVIKVRRNPANTHFHKCADHGLQMVSLPKAVFSNILDEQLARAIKPPAKKHLGK